MTSPILKLTSPVTLPGIGDLKNRMAMASLTRARTNNKEHIPNALNLEYYKQRSGAGIILTEGTHISGTAIGWVDAPGIYTEAQAEGWKKITDAVPTKMFVQLWHQGRQSHETLVEGEGATVIAPSAIPAEGTLQLHDGSKVAFAMPRALETDEIALVAKDYGKAAKLAVEKAGFAGVHIHSANGYLIDVFIQSRTNKREDKYGGSIANRLRFLSEVLDAVLEELPAEKVSIKLSPNGTYGDMGSEDFREQFDAAIEMIAERKLAFIELMDGLAFGAHAFVKEDPYTMARARAVIKRVQGDHVVTSLMGNCGYTKDSAEAMIQSGDTDLVSFGRSYISNPDLETRFAKGSELNEDQGRETWWAKDVGAKGYTDYPFLDLKLTSSVTLPGLGELKNRMAMAAMTRARTDNKEHIPNALNLEYYKQRSGAGIILTEGSHISPQAIGWVEATGIYTEAQAAGWKKITDAVPTPMFIQLWHQGRQSHESLVESKDGTVVAPSAIAAAGDVHIREGTVPFPLPRALETDEIPLIVKDYANAAKLAIEQAGFAGVHIHGANGYLIDTFIQSKTNHREDKYGGSLENRLRFMTEVIDAVLEEVPAEKVSIKLSPNGIFGDMGSEDFLETFDAAIELVATRKLAFIEIMDGLAFGAHPFVKEEPYTMARARAIVKRVQGDNVVTSLMANCGYTMETAEALIETGDADMVSFGRPYISNPDLEVRFAKRAELNEALGPETWMSFGTGARGYTSYPFLE